MDYSIGSILWEVYVAPRTLVRKSVVVHLGGPGGQVDKPVNAKASQSIRVEIGQGLQGAIGFDGPLLEVMLPQLLADVTRSGITAVEHEKHRSQGLEVLIQGFQQRGTLEYGYEIQTLDSVFKRK